MPDGEIHAGLANAQKNCRKQYRTQFIVANILFHLCQIGGCLAAFSMPDVASTPDFVRVLLQMAFSMPELGVAFFWHVDSGMDPGHLR